MRPSRESLSRRVVRSDVSNLDVSVVRVDRVARGGRVAVWRPPDAHRRTDNKRRPDVAAPPTERRDVDRPCSGTRDRFLACFSTVNRTVCVTRNVDEEPRWTSIIEMGEMGDLVVEYGGTPRGRG